MLIIVAVHRVVRQEMESVAGSREIVTAIAKSPAAPRPWAIGVSVLVQILVVLSLQYLPRIGGQGRPYEPLPVDLVYADEIPGSVAPGDLAPPRRDPAAEAPAAVENEPPAARAVANKQAPSAPADWPPPVAAPVHDGTLEEQAERTERLREGLRRWLCIDLQSNSGDRVADCPSGQGLVLRPAWDGDGVWAGGDLATLLGGDAAGLRLEINGLRKGYLSRRGSGRLPDPHALDPTVAWDLGTQIFGPLPLPVRKPPPRPTID